MKRSWKLQSLKKGRLRCDGGQSGSSKTNGAHKHYVPYLDGHQLTIQSTTCSDPEMLPLQGFPVFSRKITQSMGWKTTDQDLDLPCDQSVGAGVARRPEFYRLQGRMKWHFLCLERLDTLNPMVWQPGIPEQVAIWGSVYHGLPYFHRISLHPQVINHGNDWENPRGSNGEIVCKCRGFHCHVWLEHRLELLVCPKRNYRNIQTYIHIHTHTHIHIHIHICIYTYVRIFIYIYICTYIYVYIYIRATPGLCPSVAAHRVPIPIPNRMLLQL